MDEGEMPIPSMFISSGGTLYVTLQETDDSVLLGEFGLVEEGQYITRHEERGEEKWVFESAVKDDNIDTPPFRKVFKTDKAGVRKELHSGEFFYGKAIREAWDNWSEGDILRLTIDGDDREFEHEYERLREYDRSDRL